MSAPEKMNLNLEGLKLLAAFGGGLIISCGCVLTLVSFIDNKIRDAQERKALDSIRKICQNRRDEELEKLCEKFPSISPQFSSILQLPVEQLQQKLQARDLTAHSVLSAYVAKTVAVTKEFNCVTQFVPDMWEQADELDMVPQGCVKGPLHGVPFCVKDDHDVEGMDSTLGFSKNLDKPAARHSIVVQQLVDAGAIIFCKTNVPQTLLSSGSHNPIFGTTLNHLNKDLSPGGSSSGTACLVGAGGTPFGLGSDVGGSVRIPAHMSGVASLRPTIGRISGRGIVESRNCVAGLTAVPGVLAQRAKIVGTVFKILTEPINDSRQKKEYDPLTVPIPWKEQLFQSKAPLRIGYYTSMPFFPAIGDVPETVLNAKKVLEKMGHTLIPFDLPDNWKILDIYATLSGADGGSQIYTKLKNDQVSHVAEKFVRRHHRHHGIIPRLLLHILDKVTGVFGQNNYVTSRRHYVRNSAGEKSQVLWTYLEKLKELKYEILDKMESLQLDLILGPAYPFPAVRMKDQETLNNAAIYTFVWNLVDFPAAVVPFGKESCKNIDQYDDEGDFYLKLAKEGIKMAKDMPIGVQIIGKPFKEEMVLRILTELDNTRYKITRI